MADMFAVATLIDPYEGFNLPCAIFETLEEAQDFITGKLANDPYPMPEASIFQYSGFGLGKDYEPPCVGRYKFVTGHNYQGYKQVKE